MHHLVDGAVGPAADLAQVLQVLGREVPVLLRDLQLPRRLDAVRPQTLSGEQSSIRRCAGRPGGAGPARPGPRQRYSHVRVLEGRARRVQREPGHGFDRRVGEVQLQGFTFTCGEAGGRRRGSGDVRPAGRGRLPRHRRRRHKMVAVAAVARKVKHSFYVSSSFHTSAVSMLLKVHQTHTCRRSSRPTALMSFDSAHKQRVLEPNERVKEDD